MRVGYASKAATICVMCVPLLSYAEGEDVIPSADCACTPAPALIGEGCTAEFQCRVYCSGEPALVLDESPRVSEVDELTCNNCNDPCNDMHCVQTLCVTRTDSGTVSGSFGYSVQFKAELNNLLAGTVGIETTYEFHAGLSSTTEVSTEYCVQCGSSAVARCTGTKYTTTSYRANKVAQVPLPHRWYIRVTCPGEPQGSWRLNNECPGVVGYATIDAQKGSVSGCTSEMIECPTPCPDCITLP